MSSNAGVPVTVRILDRDYQVACADGEQEALKAAADYVHQRMTEVRGRGNVIGTDRIAVMAALNIAHELLALRESERSLAQVKDRLGLLQDRVAATLSVDA